MPLDNLSMLDQSAVRYYKSFINFIDIQSKTYADRVFIRYYLNKTYKTLTYAQVDVITTNLACKWASKKKRTGVISYINDHNVDYMITMIALMKLRVVQLSVSPRNSEAAIVNLLEKTQSKALFVTPKYEFIANDVAAKMKNVEVIVIEPFDIEAMLKQPLDERHKELIDYNFTEQDLDKPALIIHSSGSTNFPKPIYLDNRYLINICGFFQVYKEQHPESSIIGKDDVILSCVPLFHVFGFFCLASAAFAGASSVFLEKLPPSQEDIDLALRVNKCTAMTAPPLILEQMIPFLKKTNDLSAVQHLKFVLFAGAPLKRESGNWFISHDVKVRNAYGSTEMGPVMCSDLSPDNKNWNSITPVWNTPGIKSSCFFEDAENGLKHFYTTGDCPMKAMNVSNRHDNGFDSNDLFREDPDSPGSYLYVGRRDDTLIMENGEKTNPIPMENTIRQSPVVYQVAVLGHGYQCTSALIEIDMKVAINYGPEEIIALVHEAVEDANNECPSHSVILPQMIKILPFNKSLPSTDKGTVIRKRAESMYKNLVETMYKNFLEGPQKKTDSDTSTWSAEQTEYFLVQSAAQVLRLPESALRDHQKSIFDLGLNSLTAIQLRNAISQNFNNVPQNFLFQHPSIRSMREALMSDEQVDPAEVMEARYQQTQALAESYLERAKNDFPVAKNDYEAKKKDKVVLLSGATGSLGSFMLRHLLQDKSVKKVYCLIRGQDSQLDSRLLKAFESRHLDVSLLKSSRVEALPMRLSEPYLGFSKERYDQLKEEITIVQHCAWLLDFNQAIDHYDKECIAPFYNLLKFAYCQVNPMHVHFVSSVSASAALGSNVEEKPLPLDSHVAMPMGYGHSKFVCEILLNYLTSQKNFPCYIERLGQVCGDSENGVWNTSEQFPLMFIAGGSLMHKMPVLQTEIDWIPVDYAAAAISDIMLRTAYLTANIDESIYHIVNPEIVTWNDVLEAMKACGMKFDRVSSSEWVETLSKDDTNPAYRLMSFYEDSFKKDFKMPIWYTNRTREIAPVLGQSPILNADLFGKYLKHWQSIGFYSPLA